MSCAALAICLLLGESAAELNAKGEQLLDGGQSREALVQFRRAAEASPRLAAAHFNQALALARLRRRATGRLPQPSKKSVLDAVEVALKLDPSLRERAEAELPAVRSTFRGHQLLGRTIEKDSAAMLQGIAWRGRGGEGLEFLSDGTLRYALHARLPEHPPPNGRWSVERGRVTLVLGSKTHDGGLDSDGVLTLAGLGRFFDW